MISMIADCMYNTCTWCSYSIFYICMHTLVCTQNMYHVVKYFGGKKVGWMCSLNRFSKRNFLAMYVRIRTSCELIILSASKSILHCFQSSLTYSVNEIEKCKAVLSIEQLVLNNVMIWSIDRKWACLHTTTNYQLMTKKCYLSFKIRCLM